MTNHNPRPAPVQVPSRTPPRTPPCTPPPQPQQPPAPTDNPPQPQASTSKADTQDPTKNPEEEKDPTLIAYVKSYQEAGKVWLDAVEESKEQAYKMLFDKLLMIGDPHIPKFSDTDRKTVLDCIADKSGKYLSEDEFAVYVSREEVKIDKKWYAVSDEEKAVIRDYYDKAKDLCDAQAAFMQSTCMLADKIKNKEIFLEIVKQVQLPAVQVHVHTRAEEEKLEGKTYGELTLLLHLPNYRTIHPNATGQMRTMAAFMYYVLYKQITGLQKAQGGCSTEFMCGAMPFKCLVTGKKQPGGPGRVSEAGKSHRSLEDVAAIEGEPAAKKPKVTPKPRRGRGRGCSGGRNK